MSGKTLRLPGAVTIGPLNNMRLMERKRVLHILEKILHVNSDTCNSWYIYYTASPQSADPFTSAHRPHVLQGTIAPS